MDSRVRHFTAFAVMAWLPAAFATLGCVDKDVPGSGSTSAGGTADAAANSSGHSPRNALIDAGTNEGASPPTTAIATALPSTQSHGEPSATPDAQAADDAASMSAATSRDAGATRTASEPVTPIPDAASLPVPSQDAGTPALATTPATTNPGCANDDCSHEWSTEVEVVEGAPRSATLPAVTSDAQGNALAAWYQWEQEPAGAVSASLVYSIAASRYDAVTGWQEPETLALAAPGGYAGSVCISGNPKGAAVVTFVSRSSADASATYGVWATRYSTTEGWTPAAEIGLYGSVGVSECAIDEAGNALVVWSDYDSEAEETHLYANHFSPDDGWAEPEMIGGESKRVGLASLALDGDGHGVVIWNDYTNDTPHLWSNRYVGAGAWSTPAPMAVGSGFDLSLLDVALATDGSGMAVWSEHSKDGLQHQIWASRFSSSGEWSEREQLDDGSEIASNPFVSVDDGGGAVAVWEAYTSLEDGSGKNDLRTNRYVLDAGWDGPLPLASDVGSGTLSMAGNNTGKALATWRTPYDYTVDGDIAACAFDALAGWGDVVAFEADPPGDSGGPRATVNAAGKATVVWHQLPPDNMAGSDILAAH